MGGSTRRPSPEGEGSPTQSRAQPHNQSQSHKAHSHSQSQNAPSHNDDTQAPSHRNQRHTRTHSHSRAPSRITAAIAHAASTPLPPSRTTGTTRTGPTAVDAHYATATRYGHDRPAASGVHGAHRAHSSQAPPSPRAATVEVSFMTEESILVRAASEPGLGLGIRRCRGCQLAALSLSLDSHSIPCIPRMLLRDLSAQHSAYRYRQCSILFSLTSSFCPLYAADTSLNGTSTRPTRAHTRAQARDRARS